MPDLLILTRYGRTGASSRLRLLAYVPALEAAGWAVAVAPLFDDAYLARLYRGDRIPPGYLVGRYRRRIAALAAARRFDLVWLEKEALPFLPARVERGLLGPVPVVVDLDDAWFHRYDRHRRAAVRWWCGTKIDRIMAAARLVTAGSPYLAARAAAAGAPAIAAVPTVVDLARYPVSPAPAAAGDRPATVGWIGTPVTVGYLAPVARPLAALAADGRIQVTVIGAPAPDGLPAAHVPWTEAGEAAALAGLDVGIMPLPDSPWERGKCGYKLIQYMATGRPVVASPVGINRELVVDGETGFLAETPADWHRALARLAADPGLRARLGAAGRRLVEARYSLQVQTPRLVGLLRSAAAGRSGSLY